MADETQVTKYVTLDTLKSYDGKLKPWVKEKINTGLGSITLDHSQTTEGYLKSYTLKYTPIDGEEDTIGTIDIPKDFLVKSGSVVIVKEPGEGVDFKENEESTTTSGKTPGTYIKLVINSRDDDANGIVNPLYIPVAELYSDYSVKDTNTIDLTLDGHEISADVVEKSITVKELADEAVETGKIKPGAVTGGVSEEGVATGSIAKETIVNANLVNKTIETGKIKDGAVTADILGTDSVINAKIQNGAVTEDKIADANVTTDKIAAGAVTGGTDGKIASETITNDNLVDKTIARGKIATEFEEDIAALEAWQADFDENRGTDDTDLEGLKPGDEKPDDFDGFDWR